MSHKWAWASTAGPRRQLPGHGGNEVYVTRLRVEVAQGQGAVEVEADQLAPQNCSGLGQQVVEQGVDGRIGRGIGHSQVATLTAEWDGYTYQQRADRHHQQAGLPWCHARVAPPLVAGGEEDYERHDIGQANGQGVVVVEDEER